MFNAAETLRSRHVGTAIRNETSSKKVDSFSSWKALIKSCTIIKVSEESMLAIDLQDPLPVKEHWDIPILIEGHKIFSGIWTVKSIQDQRHTLLCRGNTDFSAVDTPVYDFSIERVKGGSIKIVPVRECDNNSTAIAYIAPPLTMLVRGSILSVSKLDTIEQTFDADLFFECRLRAISSYDNKKAVESVLRLYGLYDTKLPVIVLINANFNLESWHDLSVSRNGQDYDFVFKRRGSGEFTEEFKLTEFPMDEQHLHIGIKVLKDEHVVRLQNNEEFPSYFMSSTFRLRNVFAVPYDDLVFTKKSCTDEKESASGNRYPVFTMSMLFVRKRKYYVANIVFPMMVLTYLAFLSFAVNADGSRLETSDRLSITLTLLLTAVAFKFTVAQSIPQVSYLTRLDKYITYCFAFLCIICAENALFPFLESRPGVDIGSDEELGVFYALIGLFTLFNVQWIVRTCRYDLLRKKKNDVIATIERVRREVAKDPEYQACSYDALFHFTAARLEKEKIYVKDDLDMLQYLGRDVPTVGDRVLVQNRDRGVLGTVAFVGCVHDEKGAFVGVIMDNSEDGEMSGSIKGTNYFKCPEYRKGLMVPISSATKVY